MRFALEESMPILIICPAAVPEARISATFTLFLKSTTGKGKGPTEIFPPPLKELGLATLGLESFKLPLSLAEFPLFPEAAARLRDFMATLTLAEVVGPVKTSPL